MSCPRPGGIDAVDPPPEGFAPGESLQGIDAVDSPVKTPNVHPRCANVPRIGDEGFEELCHLVTEDDPDTALCGQDVTGYPWNPPWPRCEACLAIARGRQN